jgi:hypothetical protein
VRKPLIIYAGRDRIRIAVFAMGSNCPKWTAWRF